jgi:riboflavin kinase/FMN adenylyltransferase
VRIYYDLQRFKAINPVVTIGTFDGVHLGHRKVLEKLKRIASEMKGESVVFTFDPHPRQVLSPEEHNLRLLTTLEEKTELLRLCGIDHLIVFPFTKKFAKLTYEEFVSTILIDHMKAKCLVVGYDHKFGHNRKGDFDYLQKFADEYHVRIERLDVLLMDEVNISSTRIRDALETGNIRVANSYLGYPYELHGNVVEGMQIGRKIGFPTANIEATDINKLIPGYGVYAVKIKISWNVWNGMLNIGSRPTFNQNADARSIEVNIFDFNDSLYGKQISLVFIDKIRDETRFPDKDALIRQLHTDKKNALKILSEK